MICKLKKMWVFQGNLNQGLKNIKGFNKIQANA